MRVDKTLSVIYSSFVRRGQRFLAQEWFLEFKRPGYNNLQITHKRK